MASRSRRCVAAVAFVSAAVNTLSVVDALRLGEEDAGPPFGGLFKSKKKNEEPPPPPDGLEGPGANLEGNLTIFWMRHGYSCANVLNDQGKHISTFSVKGQARSKLFPMYADPSLTNMAIDYAQEMGPRVIEEIKKQAGEVPIVFSSHLVRAQETALYNFPENEVYPIPYVAEGESGGFKPSTYDNIPRPRDEQRVKLAYPPNPPNLQERVVFTPANPAAADGRDAANYEGFLANFPNTLQQFINMKKVKVGEDGSMKVIIVSHSTYMMHALKCPEPENKGKPFNNEVWVVKYNVPNNGEGPMTPVGACQKLFRQSSTFRRPPDHICPKDVARCGQSATANGGSSKMKPYEWLEASKKKCEVEGSLDDAFSLEEPLSWNGDVSPEETETLQWLKGDGPVTSPQGDGAITSPQEGGPITSPEDLPPPEEDGPMWQNGPGRQF